MLFLFLAGAVYNMFLVRFPYNSNTSEDADLLSRIGKILFCFTTYRNVTWAIPIIFKPGEDARVFWGTEWTREVLSENN